MKISRSVWSVVLTTAGVAVTLAFSDPPGPGDYSGKRCLKGSEGTEPSVRCWQWSDSWCAFAGQDCDGCFPGEADSYHMSCTPAANVDNCKSFGKGPYCGNEENRVCVACPSGGFTCVYQSTKEAACLRWRCEPLAPPVAE